MVTEYRSPDWDTYKMEMREPHRELEPPEREVAVVDEALATLREAGLLPHLEYSRDKFLAFRAAARDHFEIPWTAITPRMQRLIYVINAIAQPRNLIAAGVFCGHTFIANAGAAVGPGAVYAAEQLLGVEIVPAEAERAKRNVRRIDPTGVARILAADARQVVATFLEPIDLLYLDANGDQSGKGLYLEILEAAYDKLSSGALVLAHNSVNAAEPLAEYLATVRDPARFRASVNVILDREGLEVSLR